MPPQRTPAKQRKLPGSEFIRLFEELTANLPGEVSFSDGSLLNEEGYSTIEIEVFQPSTLHIALAHPSSEKVKVIVLEGEAEVTATVTTGQTTDVTAAVQGAGAVKLGVSIDPESSLNPAYVVVKQKPGLEETPPPATTPETTSTPRTPLETTPSEVETSPPKEGASFIPGFATIPALLGLIVMSHVFRRRRK